MRTTTSKPNRDAAIVGHPRVGGLHHRYEWRQPVLRNPVLGSLGGQIERRSCFWTIRARNLLLNPIGFR